jgi:hypothetical protein
VIEKDFSGGAMMSRKRKEVTDDTPINRLYDFRNLLEDIVEGEETFGRFIYAEEMVVFHKLDKETLHLARMIYELAEPNIANKKIALKEVRRLRFWDYEYLFQFLLLFFEYRDDFHYFDQAYDDPYEGNENQKNNPEFLREVALDKMEKEWHSLYVTFKTDGYFAETESELGHQALVKMTSDVERQKSDLAEMKKTHQFVYTQSVELLKEMAIEHFATYADVLNRLREVGLSATTENAEEVLNLFVPIWGTTKIDKIDAQWFKNKYNIQKFYQPEEDGDFSETDLTSKFLIALANKTIEFALFDKKVALLIASFLKAMMNQSNTWVQIDASKLKKLKTMRHMRGLLIDYYMGKAVDIQEIHHYFVDYFRWWWD